MSNSLAEELARRKSGLTHAKTKVTTPAGSVYYEELNDGGYTCKEKSNEKTAGFVVDNKPDLLVACPLQNVFMGSQDVVADDLLLKKYSISHVLNVGHEPTQEYAGITYSHVPILDLPESDLFGSIPRCNTFIDAAREQGGIVYVHCNAGVSRSAAVTIAYLMQDQFWSFQQAYDHLKKLRPTIQPNVGFVNQLKLYEKELGL